MSEKRVNSPRLCWLEAFVAVIDSGGVEVHAAEKLGWSASTVNRYIGSLEAWLSRILFDGNVPKAPNDFGVKFEVTARAIIKAMHGAQHIPTEQPVDS
jgi:DNA-binding transcriptional LysR family regulator